MFFDARQIENLRNIIADICIIGAGAAGIAMALEFLGKDMDVVLLEGGGFKPDPITQMLYAGVNIGLSHDQPHESRSRYLGGSTNCWGGWCRPLDELDFVKRDWVPDSGWPISKKDLIPYYERSHPRMQLGEFDYELANWSEEIAAKDSELFPLGGMPIQNILNQLSPPTRFGSAYREQLSSASNIKVFLFANTTELETNDTASTVTGAKVKTLNDKEFTVSAKTFVLAAGGIENPRLLLLSNKVQGAGLGNGRDIVGRYYMDHPRVQSSRLVVKNAERYRQLYDATLHRIHTGRGKIKRDLEVHLAPTAWAQRELGLPNSRTYLVARHGNDLSKSFIALKALQRALSGRKHFGYPMSRVAGDIIKQVPVLIANAPKTALTVAEVRMNAVLPRHEFSLETVFEPVPNPQSRVALSDKRDQLGMQQVQIDWRLTDKDRESFVALSRLVVKTLSEVDVATPIDMSADYEAQWPDNVVGCWHHMGTTRMHADPARGVVDADCKVHGVSNLYIAGSSVFPTVGSDSPTITLVALAIRLADKIKSQYD